MLKQNPTLRGRHAAETLSAPLPSAQEMRHWDKAALSYGLPECLLMENAAREAFTVLQQECGPLDGKSILLFMGAGNNGGDAVALARHLLDASASPLVVHVKPLHHYKGVTKQHIHMAKKCGVSLLYMGKKTLPNQLPLTWHRPDIIVDGLLGTGFNGPLRPHFTEVISHINSLKTHSYIFALDIPSGCEAHSGLPHASSSMAVEAHATVAFAAAKPGLILPQARPHVGKLFVRSIGMPRLVQEESPASFRLIQKNRIVTLLDEHQPNQSHKNSWGHVLVLGGSLKEADLSGAAHLAALSALRTGAGLVTAAAPKAVCASIKNTCPNMMTLSLTAPSMLPELWPSAMPRSLAEKLPQIHALAVGPGMGTGQDSHDFLLTLLATPERPRAVLDADALTLLAQSAELQKLVREDDILTPHPGEAARFLGLSSKDVQSQRFDILRTLTQKLPCVWLLKGAGTLIAQGQSPIYILPHDRPALAIAGSGDVLCGCMAALAARLPMVDSLSIAALAAVVHAECGLSAQKLYPLRGHMASDLAELIPQAMHSLYSCQKSSLQEEVYNLDDA